MSATMLEEMAREFVGRGYEVTVLTAVPSRPGGKTIPGYEGSWYTQKMQDGYKLVRIRSWQIGRNRTKLNRVLENLIFGMSSSCWLLLSQRFDKVISVPWPNLCAVIQAYAARVRRLPYYYLVMDLLPEQAESVGMIRRGSLKYRMLLWLDIVACRFSAGIFTLSEGLRKHIAESREVPESRILLTTIQVDSGLMKTINTDGSWKNQFSIPHDAFLVLFSGTLGFVSGINILSDVVPKIPDDKKLFFLIIGEGPLAQCMNELAAKYPKRMRYLPFQPAQLFHSILLGAELALVTMNPNSGIGSVPSKMYAYMLAGKPLLAAVPSNSEVDRMVKSLKCGRVVAAGDYEGLLKEALNMEAERHQLKEMGERAKHYVENHCNVTNNVDKIEEYWKRGNVISEKDTRI